MIPFFWFLALTETRGTLTTTTNLVTARSNLKPVSMVTATSCMVRKQDWYKHAFRWRVITDRFIDVYVVICLLYRCKLHIACQNWNRDFLPEHNSFRAPLVDYQQLGTWVCYCGAAGWTGEITHSLVDQLVATFWEFRTDNTIPSTK